jgi:hypothetical protein
MRAQDFLDGALRNLKFRVSFPDELVTTQEDVDNFAIEFHRWMRKNETIENAEKYFHFTDKDMLNEFKKENGTR